MVLRRIRIKPYERGLRFVDGKLDAYLTPGAYWYADVTRKVRVDRVDVRGLWFAHKDLELIVKSGKVPVSDLTVVDLKDDERALVWVDGRFTRVVAPGLFAIWAVTRQVVVEVVDAREVRLERKDLPVILQGEGAPSYLMRVDVEPGTVGVYLKEGKLQEVLPPGAYAFWRNTARVQVLHVPMRETALEVMGQELMTADKVTLRLNAVMVYRVQDARKAIEAVEDYRQALYREAQLALRGAVGARELDVLLTEKETMAEELAMALKERAAQFGVSVMSLGIKDVILPGDMKVLLNQVMEAKKAAEAALVKRREETAAMRSQANTAKLLEQSPTLMRLRELEALERVAETTNLTVVLGDGNLKDRVTKLL